MSEESVEGRLIAHRQLLGRIVAALPDTPAAAEVRAFIEERSMFQGGEEDPGDVPSPEHAIELALSEELRLVAERAKGASGAA